MKIQAQDLYHGAALTQIVEHSSFKALNRASEKYGHYLINHDRHVFVKYRSNGDGVWTFIFGEEEISAIRQQIEIGNTTYVCLVCGGSTVLALTSDELTQVLDLNAFDSSGWIKVEVPNKGSAHVSGKKGKLKRTIPHKSFPDKLFAVSSTEPH